MIGQTGFVAIFRSLRNHPVVGLRKKTRDNNIVFTRLIMEAAFSDHEADNNGVTITLKRGQTIAGRAWLADQTGYTENEIRGILRKLEVSGMIEISHHINRRLASIVTICNYEKFQSIADEASPAAHHKLTNTFTNTFTNKLTNTSEEKKQDKSRASRKRATGNSPTHSPTNSPTNSPHITRVIEQEGVEGAQRAKSVKRTPAKQLALEGGAGGQIDPEVETCFDLWNEAARRSGFKTVKVRSPDLRSAVRERLNQYGLDGFKTMLRSLEADDFRCGRKPGRDGKPWRADIGYALRNGRDGDVYVKLINSAPDDDAPAAADPYAHLRHETEDQWRGRIRTHANGYWMAELLGPPPCSKACIVPRHLIDELGLANAYDSSGRAINTHDPRHPVHQHKQEGAAA